MPYPDALKGDPKVIFFTDFDGTITMQDTNDTLTDNLGMGAEERRRQNIECLHGRLTFRQLFLNMMQPIRASYAECIEYVTSRVQLDPHFAEFFAWAESAGVPVVILSSGLIPIIRSILERDLGKERASRIEVIANHLVLEQDKETERWDGWTPRDWGFRFRDETGFGHDKSRSIRPYAQHNFDSANGEKEKKKPVLLYAGDGVSDLSAARETDLLFAKKGRDLVTYCENEGLPFTVFEDWGIILEKTKALYSGKTVEDLAKEGLEEAKEGGNKA